MKYYSTLLLIQFERVEAPPLRGLLVKATKGFFQRSFHVFRENVFNHFYTGNILDGSLEMKDPVFSFSYVKIHFIYQESPPNFVQFITENNSYNKNQI